MISNKYSPQPSPHTTQIYVDANSDEGAICLLNHADAYEDVLLLRAAMHVISFSNKFSAHLIGYAACRIFAFEGDYPEKIKEREEAATTLITTLTSHPKLQKFAPEDDTVKERFLNVINFAIDQADHLPDKVVEQAIQLVIYWAKDCHGMFITDAAQRIVSFWEEYDEDTVRSASLYIILFPNFFPDDITGLAVCDYLMKSGDYPDNKRMNVAQLFFQDLAEDADYVQELFEDDLNKKILALINYVIDSAPEIQKELIQSALKLLLHHTEDCEEMTHSDAVKHIFEVEDKDKDKGTYTFDTVRAASLYIIYSPKQFSAKLIESATMHFMDNIEKYPTNMPVQFAMVFVKQHESFFLDSIEDKKNFDRFYERKGKLDAVQKYFTELIDLLGINQNRLACRIQNTESNTTHKFILTLFNMWRMGQFPQALSNNEALCLFLLQNRHVDPILLWQEHHEIHN